MPSTLLCAQLTRDLFAIAKFLVPLTRGAHTSAWTVLNLLHIVNQLYFIILTCACPHLRGSAVAMATIRECGFELLSHPPYSPGLAPSDYHVF